ncbi:hypothetical protein KJ891_00905 [Candidatus Micrarchaeota archaeon]|nr:hypothetical protein [Candidatus Micrarchaeota archaeon]
MRHCACAFSKIVSVLLLALILGNVSAAQGECGNGICERIANEDYGTCRADCPVPKEVYLEVYWPGEGQEFPRGRKAILQVAVNADSTVLPGSDADFVHAECPGIFGEIELYDDGNHYDVEAGDGIYAEMFEILDDAAEGRKEITISAGVYGIQGSIKRAIVISPVLGIEIFTERSAYMPDSVIAFHGKVTRGGKQAVADIDAVVSFGGNVLFEWLGPTDEKGEFSAEFTANAGTPAGGWVLDVRAEDRHSNMGAVSKDINVLAPGAFSVLVISLEKGTGETAERDGTVNIIVSVFDEYGGIVEGANVQVTGPVGEMAILEEDGNGIYSGTYAVPLESPKGKQEFEVHAVKEITGVVQEGWHKFEIEILPARIKIAMPNAEKLEFLAGDEITIRARLTYPGGRIVESAAATARINENEIPLIYEGMGFYSGQYVLEIGDRGAGKIALSARDAQGNSGTREYDLLVSDVGMDYWLRASPVPWWGILIALAILTVAFYFVRTRENIKSPRWRKIKKEDSLKMKHVMHAIDRRETGMLKRKRDMDVRRAEDAAAKAKGERELGVRTK